MAKWHTIKDTIRDILLGWILMWLSMLTMTIRLEVWKRPYDTTSTFVIFLFLFFPGVLIMAHGIYSLLREL